MGLIFNLMDNAMEGQWREFCDGVRVKIRPVARSTYRKIRKEAETAMKRIKGDIDAEVDKRIYEHMVEDWEGILDQNGNLIEPTSKNIRLVCDRAIDLAVWITEESQRLGNAVNKEEEETLKN